MVTGTFSTAQIGTWKELWTVGSYQATPELTFQIGNSPATAPANMTTEFIYAGDRVLAEIHTPPAIFTDVPPTANYANDADVMAADGITTGCTATTYCPTANLLRSQMAIFIVRGVFAALNGAGNQDNFAYPTTPYFTDVPSGSYGFQWIQKLYEMGVTTGCSGTPGNLQFCPNNTTENYDTLIFTLRGRLCVSAAGANNCGSSAPIPYPSTPQYFTDINSSSPYFSYVQAAASQSIISTNNPGCTPVGNFCAFNPMKRSLMSMWIVRGVLSETSY